MSNVRVDSEAQEISKSMGAEFKLNPLLDGILAIALPLVMSWAKSRCPNMPTENDPAVFRQRATLAYDPRKKDYRRSVVRNVAIQVRTAARQEGHQLSKPEVLEAARCILDRARTADDEAFLQVGLAAKELPVSTVVTEDRVLDGDLFE